MLPPAARPQRTGWDSTALLCSQTREFVEPSCTSQPQPHEEFTKFKQGWQRTWRQVQLRIGVVNVGGLNQSELEHARDLVAALVRLHFSDQEGTKWRSVPALSKKCF